MKRQSIRLLAAVAGIFFLAGCRRCDDAALKGFERLPLEWQIEAFAKANETHCALEGSTTWFLEQIAAHGRPAVTAVSPYLSKTSTSAGFGRMDALMVIAFAARDGVDVADVLPQLRDIAAGKNGADENDRGFARLAIEQHERHHPSPVR